MDGVFFQTSLNQATNIERCIGSTDEETQISFLPVWKRELILKKRLNNGLGSCNVQSGILHGVSFHAVPTSFNEYAY